MVGVFPLSLKEREDENLNVLNKNEGGEKSL
jgi:hypothetical protein